MIFKNYEINKIKLGSNQHLLFYGKNEGFKEETINNLIKNKKNINKYEEKEILSVIFIFLQIKRISINLTSQKAKKLQFIQRGFGRT